MLCKPFYGAVFSRGIASFKDHAHFYIFFYDMALKLDQLHLQAVELFFIPLFVHHIIPRIIRLKYTHLIR